MRFIDTTKAVAKSFIARNIAFLIAALFLTVSPFVAVAAPHTIVATAGQHGVISPSGTVVIETGLDQAFTITPDSGYEVDVLTIDGSPVAPNTTHTFTEVAEDHTIDVTFKTIPLPTHTITASAGANGSITPNGTTSVIEGTDQTYTITPDSGYTVAGIFIDGAPVATDTTYTFSGVVADHTIDVTFSAVVVPPVTHTILATAGANGAISPVGSTTVVDGGDQTFAITPDLGFEVATLTIDGVTTTASTTYTFSGVVADHTIDVTFSARETHTVTTSSGSNGTITPTGGTVVFDGDTLTITITPDTGYTVDTLVVDSIARTATTTYTFTAVQGDHTVHVTFTPVHQVTASSGSNGSISNSGTSTVTNGGSIVYTITPDTGYGVATLVVNGVTTTPTTTVTFTNVTSDHTIDVTFAPTYTVVATAGVGGSITPIGTSTVVEGTNSTHTITPDTGYGIATLVVDGVSVGTSTVHTFPTITGNHTIDVTFIPLYTVTVTSGSNGSVSPSGAATVASGSNFTVTVAADAGYGILDVLINGVSVGTGTVHTLGTITSNQTVSATFAPLHTITSIVGAHGSITPSGVTTVLQGDSLTLTITPDIDYTVGTLIVDSVVITGTTTLTFAAITQDHTVSVTFIPVHTLTVTGSANGTVTPTGTTVVTEGTTTSVTITPDVGYGIATLVVDGVTTTPTTTITFTNVVSDHVVDVTFAPTYSVVTSATGVGGSITPQGTSTVLQGASITHTITTQAGYGIGTLTVDGVTTTPTTTVTFTNVTQNHTVDVTFVTLPLYTILATAGQNGNISPTGSTTVTHGHTQHFTITPAFGYGIQTLTIDGATTSPQATYDFVNVQSNHTIDATFVLLPTHTIMATAGSNGTMSPVGTTTVVEGTNQLFFITPAHGYFINTLHIDGVLTPIVSPFRFDNIQGDHTIAVTFAQLPIHTISATSSAHGAISPSGAVAVYEGDAQTFTFTPVFGYVLTGLTVDGVTTTPTTPTTYTFSSVTGNHTIAATFGQLPTHTITATRGANGTISPQGAVSVFDTYTQTFTITPDVGYSIAMLLVDGVTTTPTTTVTFTNVTADHTIDVTFTGLPTFTITGSAGPNGTVNPQGVATVFLGDTPTYTITPAFGYEIVGLTIDGVSVATTTTYTFPPVSGNHTISATFALLPTFGVTLTTQGSGTVTGPATIPSGYTQSYTITPNTGHMIGTLTVDGVTITPTTTVTFTNVVSTHAIDVIFVPRPTHTITATVVGNGVVSPVGATIVFEGDTQVFTITPDSGYTITALVIDGVATTTGNTLTFTDVHASHTIVATFTRIEEEEDSSGSSSESRGSSSRGKDSSQSTTSPSRASLTKQVLLLQDVVALLTRSVALTRGTPVPTAPVDTTKPRVTTTLPLAQSLLTSLRTTLTELKAETITSTEVGTGVTVREASEARARIASQLGEIQAQLTTIARYMPRYATAPYVPTYVETRGVITTYRGGTIPPTRGTTATYLQGTSTTGTSSIFGVPSSTVGTEQDPSTTSADSTDTTTTTTPRAETESETSLFGQIRGYIESIAGWLRSVVWSLF